ncbi:hypothetical protein I350_02751 [Cryptococcus amylolentus CBS 6273]|nr:hypothetical protein I350_02751 [Cryptococcus amylolentus CBS 6273]
MVDSAQRRGKGSKNELPTSSSEIEPMEDSTQIVCALRDPELTKNTDYVKAVLGSYIKVKKSHGRPVEAISKKLEPLEEEYPRLADSFIAIRKEHGLPSSNILEPPAKVKLSERVAERRHLHRKGAGAEQGKV